MPPVVPYQQMDLEVLGLTPAQCETAVQYVARDHRVYAAEDGVSALLLAVGLVQLGQFLAKYKEGPAVGGNVVHGHQKNVLVGG